MIFNVKIILDWTVGAKLSVYNNIHTQFATTLVHFFAK